MNRNCSVCNIKIDIKNFRKDRTVCKTCYNKNKRKNNNIILTLKIENDIVSTYENRANVVIGPRNVGKTFYMLKVLEKIGKKRPIHIINHITQSIPQF